MAVSGLYSAGLILAAQSGRSRIYNLEKQTVKSIYFLYTPYIYLKC